MGETVRLSLVCIHKWGPWYEGQSPSRICNRCHAVQMATDPEPRVVVARIEPSTDDDVQGCH